MTLTVLAKNFKAHPLLHTVALSAVIHLMAFIFFPNWNSPSIPERETVIKIKHVLEKKEVSDEIIAPKPEKTVERKLVESKKIPEIIRPKLRMKSAIIKNVKVAPTPPSVNRNPVPIRHSEKLFKPANTVLKQTPIPNAISKYKKMAPLEISQAIRPSPRMNREAVLKNYTTTHESSPNPNVRIRSFTEAKYEYSPKPASLASSKINTENSFPLKTVAIQKPLPVTSNEVPLNSQPIAEIRGMDITKLPNPSTTLMARKPPTLNETGVVRVGKNSFKPLTIPIQTVETQARSPQSLNSEITAQYQPVIPIAANHFSSALRSSSLLKETSIPLGFSDETLNEDEEVTTGPPEKVARLSDGVSDLPSELLNQIRNGFSTKIRNRIAQVKYYPRIARKRGFEGQPVVAFTLGNGGELLELFIEEPSPFKLLNEAALDAVKSASPYPPIPELLKINSMKFNLPISFILEER
jgi:TonB family protein